MGRRYAVSQLPPDQVDFVMRSILGGLTDREISSAFETQFSKKLAKSSIQRWKEAAGDELAHQYRFARAQSKQLLEDLGDAKADKLETIFGQIEDRLLVSAREVINKDPVKLLQLRMDEENRRLKEREVAVKERQLEMEIARAKALDPKALPGQVLEALLEYIGKDESGLRWFSSHSKKLEKFLSDKYAAA